VTERVAMARRLRLGLTAAGMALLLVRVMPAAVARDPLPTAGTGRPAVEFEVGHRGALLIAGGWRF